METSSDRTQPYPIKLPSQHSSGELRVGWRSFPVNLIDISWNAITVDLPLGTAKRLRLNSKATVLYQGNYWHTRIVEKATRNGNRAILSMCLAENDDPRVQRLKNKKQSLAPVYGEQALSSDPVALAVLIVGFLSMMLIMMNTGSDGSGTSLTRAIEGFFRDIKTTFSSYF